jgi:hypothetical protein
MPSEPKKIKEAVAEIRAERPMTFAKAWNVARTKHPELFGVSPGGEPANVALARPDSDFAYKQAIGIINAEAPYIELRAEDVDELERQVAAGLWD